MWNFSNGLKTHPIYLCVIYPLCVKCFHMNGQLQICFVEYPDFILFSDVLHALAQWFPNGVSRGTTRCVAKLKKYIFKLILIMIKN
jgi:hypothetical protein